MANENASDTAVLDVLMEAERLRVRLESDGEVARFAWADRHRVPTSLRMRLHAVAHDLAQLIGRRTIS
jgi:hypothetical protein